MAETMSPYAEAVQSRDAAKVSLTEARTADRQESSDQSRAERMAKSREYGAAKSEVRRARWEMIKSGAKDKFNKLTEGLGSFFKKFSGENRAQFVEGMRAKWEDTQTQVVEKVDDIRVAATEKVHGVIAGAQEKWLEGRIAKGESKVESYGGKMIETMKKIDGIDEQIALLERVQQQEEREIKRCEHVVGLTQNMKRGSRVEALMNAEIGDIYDSIDRRAQKIDDMFGQRSELYDKYDSLEEKQGKTRDKLERRRRKYGNLQAFLQVELGRDSTTTSAGAEVTGSMPEVGAMSPPQLPPHEEGAPIYDGNGGIENLAGGSVA